MAECLWFKSLPSCLSLHVLKQEPCQLFALAFILFSRRLCPWPRAMLTKKRHMMSLPFCPEFDVMDPGCVFNTVTDPMREWRSFLSHRCWNPAAGPNPPSGANAAGDGGQLGGDEAEGSTPRVQGRKRFGRTRTAWTTDWISTEGRG